MTRRRGYSLVELLVVLVLFVAVFAAIAEPMRRLFGEVPRVARMAHEHGTLQGLLEVLQQDIDAAEGLLACYGSYEADDEILLLSLSQAVIVWQVGPEGVSRRVVERPSNIPAGREQVRYLGDDPNAPGAGEGPEKRTWVMPCVLVSWSARMENPESQMVAVTTGVYPTAKRTGGPKLQNVRVFFLGALPARVIR